MTFLSTMFSDRFVDELLVDSNDKIVFMSMYGNDGLLHSLCGKISLPWGAEESIQYIGFKELSNKSYRVEQEHVSKIGRIANDHFISLSQLFYFDCAAVKPDFENKHRYLVSLLHESEQALRGRLWQTVKQLSEVPLLNEWENTLLSHIEKDCDMIHPLKNASNGKLRGYEIALSRDFSDCISLWMREGILATPDHLLHEFK